MKLYVPVCAAVAACGWTVSAPAQSPTYTFQMRLIPDGTAESPSGSWAMYPLPSNYDGSSIRIGFWLQARVAQVGGQNWGVTRAASTNTMTSLIAVTSATGFVSAVPGTINSNGQLIGRGTGYRGGGSNTVENGLQGFDAYVGASRTDGDFDGDEMADDDGDEIPENPWGVNGTRHEVNVSGVPYPSDGTFAPWANIYRVWVNISSAPATGSFTLYAQAGLQGAIQAAQIAPDSANFAMQLGPAQNFSTTYTLNWGVPTPGGAALMAMGIVSLGRRRR